MEQTYVAPQPAHSTTEGRSLRVMIKRAHEELARTRRSLRQGGVNAPDEETLTFKHVKVWETDERGRRGYHHEARWVRADGTEARFTGFFSWAVLSSLAEFLASDSNPGRLAIFRGLVPAATRLGLGEDQARPERAPARRFTGPIYKRVGGGEVGNLAGFETLLDVASVYADILDALPHLTRAIRPGPGDVPPALFPAGIVVGAGNLVPFAPFLRPAGFRITGEEVDQALAGAAKTAKLLFCPHCGGRAIYKKTKASCPSCARTDIQVLSRSDCGETAPSVGVVLDWVDLNAAVAAAVAAGAAEVAGAEPALTGMDLAAVKRLLAKMGPVPETPGATELLPRANGVALLLRPILPGVQPSLRVPVCGPVVEALRNAGKNQKLARARAAIRKILEQGFPASERFVTVLTEAVRPARPAMIADEFAKEKADAAEIALAIPEIATRVAALQAQLDAAESPEARAAFFEDLSDAEGMLALYRGSSLIRRVGDAYQPAPEPEILEMATNVVDEAVETYVLKNLEKLNPIFQVRSDLAPEVPAAVTYARRTVEGVFSLRFGNGDSFRIATKIVVNHCNYRPYHQYPTTFHNVVLRGTPVELAVGGVLSHFEVTQMLRAPPNQAVDAAAIIAAARARDDEDDAE